MTAAGREEHPTACSMRVGLEFDEPMEANAIRNRLDVFLGELTGFLRENGCTLIGHIKGMFDARERGQLFFSVTSFEGDARYKGEIEDEIATAELSLNVIVYGVEQEPIETAVRHYLEASFS